MANQEEKKEKVPYEAPRLFDLSGGIAHAGKKGKKEQFAGKCKNGNKAEGGAGGYGHCGNGNKALSGSCDNGNWAGQSCSNGTKFK